MTVLYMVTTKFAEQVEEGEGSISFTYFGMSIQESCGSDLLSLLS